MFVRGASITEAADTMRRADMILQFPAVCALPGYVVVRKFKLYNRIYYGSIPAKQVHGPAIYA
jgi:hypothetical protein